MNLSMVLGLLGGLGIFDWYAADGGRITKSCGGEAAAYWKSLPLILPWQWSPAHWLPLVQSSSTTTVMTVGFVNAGLTCASGGDNHGS